MTTTHMAQGGERRPHHRTRRAGRGILVLPLMVLVALVAGAVAYVAYVLWPRWPGPPVAADSPALPITIANVAFNVPPAAIRVPLQRRPGAQDRIDLAFLWPALDPPPATAKPSAPPPGAEATPAKTFSRIFVTISAAGSVLPPGERVQLIYQRYTEATPVAGPSGLAVLAFRTGTAYQGEDLLYDGAEPGNFLVRCTRNVGPTPGICLYERRIEAADVVVRFPRDWLDDWRAVASGIDRLIKRLRPHG